MPSETVTDHCPHWCARAHPTDAYGTVFYHASEITSVIISRPGGLTVPDRPDRLDVQTAQYLPDDPGEPAWSPAVEIAVHAGRPLPADRADAGRSQGTRRDAGESSRYR